MIQGNLTIGPLSIPYILILIVTGVLAAHLPVALVHGKERMKDASDRLFSLLFIYIAVWRLSLLLTHFEAIRGSLTAFFVLPGAMVNHILAAAAVGMDLTVLLYRRKMDRRQFTSLSLLLGISFIAYLALLYPAARLIPEPPAPENSTSIKITTFDGREETLVLDGSSATVINFWASWCPPCQAELPELRRWWEEYKDGDIRFYALNMTGTEKSKENLFRFIEEEARGIPVYLDSRGLAAAKFSVSALPTTMVFDREGKLVKSRTGAVDMPWLANAVKQAEKE